MTSASCFTAAESVWTRCSAMRSAERGPMPGSLLSAAIRREMDSGSEADFVIVQSSIFDLGQLFDYEHEDDVSI